MNQFERAARNQKIVALNARGFSEHALAERFNMERTSIHKILDEWRKTNPTLRNVDPLTIIDEMLVGYQADLNQLGEIAEHGHGNVAIGAINARMAARDRIIALLQSTGVLPHDLGKLRVELDVRFIAQKLVMVLNQHGIADDVQKDLLEALQSGEVGPPQPIPLSDHHNAGIAWGGPASRRDN